jgi:glycoprotein-N-acetylgalactosamine 3-beta-galactosyltransferase
MLGVNPVDTKDELGRERFNNFDVRTHYFGPYPEWYVNRSFVPPQNGANCCSDQFISFHYMIPDYMYRLVFIVF